MNFLSRSLSALSELNTESTLFAEVAHFQLKHFVHINIRNAHIVVSTEFESYLEKS